MSEQKNNVAVLGTDREITDGVLDWFKVFASVPHGSGNEKALSDLLKEMFIRRGWSVEQDGWSNLKVDVPGAPGLEHLPPVILQGHLDMVCAVKEGGGYIPERDPITMVIEDGVLRSDGRSSLGADNGLGNSCGFYLLDKPLKRGPIRLILTTVEETGMTGAQKLDSTWLAGCRRLINLDSGCVGVSIVSCSGGLYQECTQKVELEPNRMGAAFELKLSGFRGGHSGAEIHLGRGNPIKLLAYFLQQLRETVDYRLADFRGGHATNAIPLEARVTLCADAANEGLLRREVERFGTELGAYYKNIDPGAKLDLTPTARPGRVWAQEYRDRVLDFVELLHNGVYARYDTMPDKVFASANVGKVEFDKESGIRIGVSIRSATPFPEVQLASRHLCAAKLTGFKVETGGQYPGWPGDESNPLAQLIDRVYRKQTGRETKILVIHAGLEPAIFGAKVEGLQMVSIGPDVWNPHSTGERAPLERLPLFVRVLAGVLEELATE